MLKPIICFVQILFIYTLQTAGAVKEQPVHKEFANDDSSVMVEMALEIEDDTPEITLVFKLYNDSAPMTVANFYMHSVGIDVNGQNLSYVNSTFHRIIPNFMFQGGKTNCITANNIKTTEGCSIFDGLEFADEKSNHTHHRRGMLSMANRGPNTNGSQFFVTFVPTGWLDGKHTVFGELLDTSMIGRIEKVGTPSGKPRKKVTIIRSGAYKNSVPVRYDKVSRMLVPDV